jgi:hypothetical protein
LFECSQDSAWLFPRKESQNSAPSIAHGKFTWGP